MQHHNSQTGFTLMEVLIALVVLAIALTAIVLTTSESIKITMQVKDKIVANRVATNILSSVDVMMITLPADGQPVQGSTNLMNTVWMWELAVDPQQEDTNAYFKRIYVTVKKIGSDHIIERMESYIRTPRRRGLA